jgi:FtsP/CotA-like multicopper oxidase with cupredoxin domain
MTRRELLALTGTWASSVVLLDGQHGGGRARHPPQTRDELAGPADLTLRIREVSLELAPRRTVRTLAYNGQVPGPMLRARRGVALTVDVWNDSRDEDIVHWHGLHVPPEVDGVYEEGTPGVPPGGGRRRYVFTPGPAGTRWYHSHNPAGRNLKLGTYSGQFGMLIVEDGDDPGAYDQEIPILLHEWDPFFRRQGPLDVEFRVFSINGRILGAGEPIRVRESQRVLFRIVNASATLGHQLSLPGHVFRVIALDGNPVPHPVEVPVVDVAPGERVDATVEMDHPGVWVLGGLKTPQREAGLGIVVEYAGRSGPPRWVPPAPFVWDYTAFGQAAASAAEPDGRLTMAFRARDDGHHWMINGQSWPDTDPIVVERGKRYRWLLDNQSADPHPLHLHRHTFELVSIAGRPTSGVWKDVVVVPAWKQAEIDVVADQPGLALFHCHQQFHMDNGFMAMMRYAG